MVEKNPRYKRNVKKYVVVGWLKMSIFSSKTSDCGTITGIASFCEPLLFTFT